MGVSEAVVNNFMVDPQHLPLRNTENKKFSKCLARTSAKNRTWDHQNAIEEKKSHDTYRPTL
jgi:hypothetical protein